MKYNNFINRHIGISGDDLQEMFRSIGTKDLDSLMQEVVPDEILLKEDLDLPVAMSEYEYLHHIKSLAAKNKLFKTYIGQGYYNTILPPVIQRNVLENPGWYTSYTPYQAEISQGRLEALMNFQTMISSLTGMPMANASLLDEGTAAAEAMLMFFNTRSRTMKKADIRKFFVSGDIFTHTQDVLRTRAEALNIELLVGQLDDYKEENIFGAIFQYPDKYGNIIDYSERIKDFHEKEIPVALIADLMSLVILKSPFEMGADVAIGSSQRFGTPMGYGGPHAGYFATLEKYKRNIPGRIIGYSHDRYGKKALRMALQTREQHIKREKATSNICTAQALLASMAGFYALYHGAKGLKQIANDIHLKTRSLSGALENIGYKINNQLFFDTININLNQLCSSDDLMHLLHENKINILQVNDQEVQLSIDETSMRRDIVRLVEVFAKAAHKEIPHVEFKEKIGGSIPASLIRNTDILEHPVFNQYHSETEMMRYMKRLEEKDLALNRSMTPLGSCTMKLNPAVSLFALSWPEFGEIHPFVPKEQAQGYYELIENLERYLQVITGFAAISFQPNSGAAGEYAGLLVIKKYLEDQGEGHRRVCLIPSSAHGTNPASSVMAGFQVVIVKAAANGDIDIEDLRVKAEQHKDNLAAIMITYPSTHGIYENGVKEITDIIHSYGGQVYMDGANMNAQVGITNPATIGADVCHLNLHKTFGIPHGGGGPGVGPIGVAEHLKDYLPNHSQVNLGNKKGIRAVASSPFGSAMILPVSYAYLLLLGKEGLKKASQYAILNANYLKSELAKDYDILYSGNAGRVAHEFIIDCSIFFKDAGIQVIDIAKRLMDYGFHAPTVAFPVHGTLMVEPTESESLPELKRFIYAMRQIRKEIEMIRNNELSHDNNPIKNAPHPVHLLLSKWDFPYDKNLAVNPMKMEISEKYWTPVARIDDAYGDRNLMCTCLPIEDYE
jgi:glycine dehydrogenase